ncbi:MAG: glycosyltransferase family 2 protein [Anaerolineales bacterium]|jgi:chlorobactene glucosyltransferase
MTAIHVAIALIWLTLSFAVLVLLVRRYRALKPLSAETVSLDEYPQVSVIVPARNEAGNIESFLQDLGRQAYPTGCYEVVVVNDGSTDATRSRALTITDEHPEFDLLDAGPLPQGWLGKPHACWVGAQRAGGDWLCFLDADTRLAPQLLFALMAQAVEADVDLLSLHPRQYMLGFWERLLMPVPFMTLMILMDAQAINDPQSPRAMANGQCILIRRSVYDEVGGHRAVHSAVLDDVRLAELVKGAGFRIQLLGGGELIHTRMYSDLPSLWQGLARGGSELFGLPLTVAAIFNALFAAVFPLAYPAWLSLWPGNLPEFWLAIVLSVGGTLIWYTAHALELRRHRVPLGYLALLPLSNILIAVVNAEGVLRRLCGRRIWKGRQI